MSVTGRTLTRGEIHALAFLALVVALAASAALAGGLMWLLRRWS